MKEIITHIDEKKRTLDNFRPLPTALVKNLDHAVESSLDEYLDAVAQSAPSS